MTVPEAEAYFENLNATQAIRFNLLVKTALMLGKPIEGAYDYAKLFMEGGESNG